VLRAKLHPVFHHVDFLRGGIYYAPEEGAIGIFPRDIREVDVLGGQESYLGYSITGETEASIATSRPATLTTSRMEVRYTGPPRRALMQ
jgi:hypothetical protein